MTQRKLLTGNATAAWGARLADVDYISAFPITPQTEIIELLAYWAANGEVAGRFVTFDSEHSMLTAAGAIFRGLDFWYFCYDNESYGNTGMQMSSATPYGARTMTTPVGAKARAGTEHGKKDLFEIWRAHRPAYLATVSPRFPIDLTNKFLQAKKLRGPKLFIAHAPCPTGWLYDPEQTANYARLAVETGIFALKETRDGVITHTYVPRRHIPVEEYLRGQGRYRHLFEPTRNEEAIQQIQEQVDRYWAGVTETTGAAR